MINEGVSVVIPCFNEVDYIEDCINSFVNNVSPINKLEILIVDGGSKDGTLLVLNSLAKKHSFIKIIHNKQKHTPYALNLGVKNATKNHILIAGAHSEYPTNYIGDLYNHLKNKQIDVVGGAIETLAKSDNKKTNSICFVLSHPFGVGNAVFRIGAKQIMQVDTVPFGLYPREVFSKVGFYNEKLIRNHDIELSKRILANGYKIWLDPTLKVKYFARESYKALFENNYKNGFWNIKTVWITKRFASLSLRHFVPLFFVLSLILPIVACFFYKYLIFIALASFFLYVLVVFFVALKRSKGTSVWHIIISFFTLHFSYGLGSLAAFFSLRNRGVLK